METVEILMSHLKKCRSIANKGYTSAKGTKLDWLNSFCAEFLLFANRLQNFIATDLNRSGKEDSDIDIVYLCLTQIVTSIKHLERTIKAEDTGGGIAISASRQHFLDRIQWCIERLRTIIGQLMTSSESAQKQFIEESTFVDLMDLVMDHLSPYCTYKERLTSGAANVAEENAAAMSASKQIRSVIDPILSHTLSFANVALKEDKKALSAVCQKVLRECVAFQDECALGHQQGKLNECDLKLKARSLENALYHLEDYINEALLRLVYTCFLDYDKFSIERLRNVLRLCDHDDTALDEIIADFDVNVDRTTQIGIYAISFAPNVKIKTAVRSCLASLESLDACIIPSLYTKNAADIHSEILEQHFNEEVASFKSAIQEIVDSHAFAACYHEMVSQSIAQSEKHFNKLHLQDIAQMGDFLYQHFQTVPVNAEVLRQQADRLKMFERFTLMLRECQSILMCAAQVDAKRILKRFKILRSVLGKFVEALNEADLPAHRPRTHSGAISILMSDELSDSQQMFASIGIAPSICSILYRNETTRRRMPSDSLRVNYSCKPPSSSPIGVARTDTTDIVDSQRLQALTGKQTRSSIRRKESLRTTMFKRQKSTETERVYNMYKSMSACQISEILDQLSGLSSNFSRSSHSDSDGNTTSRNS